MPEPRPPLPETISPKPLQPSEQPTLPEPAESATMPPPDDELAAVTIPPRPVGASTFGEHVDIPGYEILGKLGEGGMGVVYKARHLGLNRLVALKMIRAGYASDDLLQRFQGEAKAVAKLQYPNIVQIYDIGRHDGCPYLALEYVAGGSLDRLLNGTPQPLQAAAELVETLARAMHVAHLAGIVHRDLKPANVLIADCGLQIADSKRQATSIQSAIRNPQSAIPKITDFGLAKQLDADSGQTRPDAVMGTPSYMAPEQAGKNKTVGPAADVYALGAILYELLTGRPPFKAATPLETVLQVISDEPVPPRQLQSKVPRDLETICLKCLQKEPAKRYEAARGLADDLRRFLNGEPIQARPVGQAERFGRWCRRNPVVAGLAGAVAAVLILGVAISTGLSVWALDEREQANQRAGELKTANTSLDGALLLAKTNEKRADDRADDALANLEQFQVANGLRELESGQFYKALQWFAMPLHGEGANTYRALMYRDRLSNYWRRPQDVDATRHLLAHSLKHQGVHAAFSPDGRRVVTGSDNTAQVWDAATGRPVGPPLQHRGFGIRAAFSPDGRRVVTTNIENTARVWDADTGQLTCPPLQHKFIVNHAAFSPDGHHVVTASTDSTARVWDAATGQPVGPPLQHQDEVKHASFSPNGCRILTAGSKTARLWDAVTRQPTSPPLQHPDYVEHAAFSPDGRLVVTVTTGYFVREKEARLWDAATGKPASPALQHRGLVTAVFSPDGRRVVTASHDKTARLWDATTGQPAGPPLQHQSAVESAVFSPDGRRIITGSGDGARVWDAATGQPVGLPLWRLWDVAVSPDGRRILSRGLWDAATGHSAVPPLQHQYPVYHAAFSPDGRRVVTASGPRLGDTRPGDSGSGEARVWDAATGEPVGQPLQHRSLQPYVVFSPDCRHVVTASDKKTARVWDAWTGEPIGPPLQHQYDVFRAAFSPDGHRVVTANRESIKLGWLWDAVRVWDAATGQPACPPLEGGGVLDAAFSPDGRRVVTAGETGTIQVWDAATGQPAGPPFRGVSRAAFSPDGCRVVTFGFDLARVWDAATGQPVGPPLKSHRVYAAFSPDSRRVVTAGDKTARVWDAATGLPAGPPLQHQGDVTHAAFSPDSRRVVTAGKDKTARVWDAVTGQPAGPPLQHQEGVSHAAFSPDGRRVVTASGKEVRVWDVSTDDRPAEDWIRLTQFFAGKLDRFGGHEPLTPKEMEESWNYLRTKYPQDFTVTPAQVRAWHRREAEACQKERNPAAALFHTLYGCDLNWALPWGLGRL